jgi:hypothetical protein
MSNRGEQQDKKRRINETMHVKQANDETTHNETLYVKQGKDKTTHIEIMRIKQGNKNLIRKEAHGVRTSKDTLPNLCSLWWAVVSNSLTQWSTSLAGGHETQSATPTALRLAKQQE